VQGLEVLDVLLGGHQLGGEGLRGLLELGRLGLVALGPGLVASTSDCRADAWNFSTSPSCRFSFISSCRWLPITAAACWDSAWCCF